MLVGGGWGLTEAGDWYGALMQGRCGIIEGFHRFGTRAFTFGIGFGGVRKEYHYMATTREYREYLCVF